MSPSVFRPRVTDSNRQASDISKDPFLQQYLKGNDSTNQHTVYFQSLKRERRISLVDVYNKYLRLNEQAYRKYLPRVKVITPPVPKYPSHEVSSKQRTPRLPVTAPSLEVVESVPQVRLLPSQFMDCAIEDLIILISRMLQSLISLNDKLVPSEILNDTQPSKKALTRYHSRTPPLISIHTYLSRLTKFNNFNQATLLTTIYYIDLLSHHYQPFFTLNSWTVHRFLLVATMLAQKSMEDFFYTNDHYAKVGGVAINELNCLEMDFLNRVDWHLIPAKQLEDGTTSIKNYKEILDLYYAQLIQLMGKSKNDSTVYVGTDDNDSECDSDISYENYQPQPYVPDASKYNERGYAMDGSLSPHLKRQFEP